MSKKYNSFEDLGRAMGVQKKTRKGISPHNIILNKKIISISQNNEIIYTEKCNQLFDLWRREKKKFNEVNISTLIYNIAKQKPYNFELKRGQLETLGSLSHACVKQIAKFKPQDLANTVWAYATLNHESESLLEAVSSESVKQIAKFKPQALANTVWAYATLNHEVGEENVKFYENYLFNHPVQYNSKQLSQIYQASIINGMQIPDKTLIEIENNFEDLKTKPLSMNNFEKDVLKYLSQLDLAVTPQYFIDGYSLDFLVEINGNKWAVECDGVKYHCVGGGPSGRSVGSDVIKDKILKIRNFNILHIKDSDWRRIKDKQGWLKNKLGIA